MNALGIKVLVGVFLLAAAVFGWNWYIGGIEREFDKAGYARAVREFKDAELRAIQAVRAEEMRRQKALEGVIRETQTELAAARADGDAAAAAGERLRDQLAALRRSRSGPGAATAGGSKAADAAERMLAELQRRAHEAEERVSRFADESRIAGQACVRAYEALTAK